MTVLILYLMQMQTMATENTSQPANSNEELLFRIKWSRAEQLLHTPLADSSKAVSLPADIQQSLADAKNFANCADYTLAIPFIDIVLIYLEEQTLQRSEKSSQNVRSSTSFFALCGSDLWQQKFSISIDDADSSIFENQNNAFIGIRFSFNPTFGAWQNSRAAFEAKHSHDYASGNFEFSQRFKGLRKFVFLLENRAEGTHYYRDQNLRYWHDRFRSKISWIASAKTMFSIEDEVQLRKYSNKSALFTSFWQNQASLLLDSELPLISKSELRYDCRLRYYPQQPEQNYLENLLSLMIWPNWLNKIQFNSFTQWRLRDYARTFIDSLMTNPFSEIYTESAVRYGFWENWSLNLGLTFNMRTYQEYTSAMPNYRDLLLDVAMQYHFSTFGSIKIGYRNRNKHHYFSSHPNEGTAQIEDFYAHAPIAEIDIFFGKFLLNISEAYEMRRYPHSPDGGLSLYADRDVNTLFFLLSWTISSKWEINVMANIDDDSARTSEAADSRSNIFNFELLYKL